MRLHFLIIYLLIPSFLCQQSQRFVRQKYFFHFQIARDIGHEWGRAQILHEDEVNPNYDGEAGVSPVQAEDFRRLCLARSSDTKDDKFSEVTK